MEQTSETAHKTIYPDFCGTWIDVKRYPTDGRILVDSLPSSVLPLCKERESSAFTVKFKPDSSVEEAVERRINQGRKSVFKTCCKVLNPLEAVTCVGNASRNTYKITEVLVRAGEGIRLHALPLEPKVVIICTTGKDAGLEAVMHRLGVYAAAEYGLDDCLSAKKRAVLLAACKTGSKDLFIGDGIGTLTGRHEHSHQALAQFVVALQCLRPGGSLVLKLLTLEGSMISGLIFAAARWFFTGCVALCKPEFSRPTSDEVYLVATGRADTVVGAVVRGPTVSEVEVWLERSGLSKLLDVDASVRLIQRDETAAPFVVDHGFGCCVKYWTDRFILLRQHTTRRALDLCRIIIEHRPMVCIAQLRNLLEACTQNLALRELARDYMKRWPVDGLRRLSE